MRPMLSSVAVLIAWTAAALALSACSSARISQVDGFAAAGIKYADTVPAVFNQSFEVAVKTDTLVLMENRPRLGSRLSKLDELEKSKANLTERLAILNSLKAHMAGLRAYFVALKALAASDTDSGITQATKDLTGTLSKLSSNFSKLQIGGTSIVSFAGQAVPIAVAQFRSVALTRELRERGTAIERELNLQEAALAAIAAQMRADLATQLAAHDRDRIDLPYVNDGSLPTDWTERRLDSLRRRLDMTAADAAVSAAKTLRLSYIALAEDRLEAGGVSLLIGDIDKMAMLIEGVGGKAASR